MTSPTPTILIVGGAYHPEAYLQPLAMTFKSSGYDSKCLALPSAGAKAPPPTDFSGDVAAIRDIVIQLTKQEGKDVIVVLHSASSIAGTEALHGLGKKREEQSNDGVEGGGGVVAIVYIASPVPKKGHSFHDHMTIVLGDRMWEPTRQMFEKDGYLDLPREVFQQMCYNDIDEDQAKHWASLLMPQAIGPSDSRLTYETYRDIPSGYVLTTLDKAFPYDYQLKTVDLAGLKKENTLTLETGHVPWFTKPDEVVAFVLRVAGEK